MYIITDTCYVYQISALEDNSTTGIKQTIYSSVTHVRTNFSPVRRKCSFGATSENECKNFCRHVSTKKRRLLNGSSPQPNKFYGILSYFRKCIF